MGRCVWVKMRMGPISGYVWVRSELMVRKGQ